MSLHLKKFEINSRHKFNDFINSTFKFGSAAAIIISIIALADSKQVSGVHWGTVLWLMLNGYWNIYFYKSIHKYWSWLGGVFITVTNTVWLAMILYYG